MNCNKKIKLKIKPTYLSSNVTVTSSSWIFLMKAYKNKLNENKWVNVKKGIKLSDCRAFTVSSKWITNP